MGLDFDGFKKEVRTVGACANQAARSFSAVAGMAGLSRTSEDGG